MVWLNDDEVEIVSWAISIDGENKEARESILKIVTILFKYPIVSITFSFNLFN